MPFLKPSSRTLALLASVLVLSLSAGYIALAWTEPTGTMPVTVAAPLNTGNVAQTKSGALAIQGNLTAPIFYDADDPTSTYYVNPSGQTVLAGPVGIGTASSGSALDVRGTITTGNVSATNGPVLLQGYYGDGALSVLGSEYSSGAPMLGYGVKPSTSATGSFLSSSGISNLYRSALTLGGSITFYTGLQQTAAIGSAAALSPAMTIQNDGKIVINNGGQLCIGATCASSSTWNTIVNSAGGGGGGLSGDIITIPTNGLFGRDYTDISFDPLSNRLVAVASYDSIYPAAKSRVIVDLDNLSVKTDQYNYAYAIYSSGCIGDWCCDTYNLPSDNFDASGPLMACQNLSTGATMYWCTEGNPWCTTNPLLGSNVITRWDRSSLKVRSDGTYLYVLYYPDWGGCAYTWKISSSMVLVDRGASLARPSVNGIPIQDLGSRVAYQNKIYEVRLTPDIATNTSGVGFIAGYSFFWLHQTGSY